MIRHNRTKWAILAMLACSSLSVAATAAVKQAVWTGTIASGFDTAGIFGPAGTDLGGLSYKAVFRFDPGLAGVRLTTADYDVAYGGTVYGVPSPMLYAAITINGVTHVIPTGNQDDIGAHPAVGSGMQLRHDQIIAGEIRMDFLRLDGVIPGWPSLDATLPTTTVPGFVESLMYIKAPIFVPYQPNDAWADLGNFKTVSISNVPEPASWMLMIVGFGITGLGLRRRAVSQYSREQLG